ncbi:hypothetical protein VCV18_012537 [Metarhizium anisopliae]|uniref:Uncharacterized protein n=1 Tax=Metarhizium rileyi (strain RCEF 4871) TaxID=1649241 RepID=A0A5C6G191_METRR|nr:hypothetical protein ED733_002756 [Metarhizium rileyi]
MWTEDESGKEMQRLIALGATEAGFDSDILDFTTEPEAASDYIEYLQRKAVQEEQETMLLQQRKAVQQERRRKQLTAPGRHSRGGAARRPRAFIFFKDAKTHVEGQCESPWNDLISDGMKIPG